MAIQLPVVQCSVSVPLHSLMSCFILDHITETYFFTFYELMVL
jgi:hypothetical protein